jgi:predicted anti-sigma-YlaC factor YlaD
MSVSCADCREDLSARLDGEDEPRTRTAVDAHLASCAECQQWFDDAARITRLARTSVARPTPDLADAVAARVPVPRFAWWRVAVRAVVAVVGLGQLALAMAQVLGGRGEVAHTGDAGELEGASMLHFAHESAAWNMALGVGFLWVAWRVCRATGLVPTLTAFVLVLAALTALDVAQGHVDTARLASHALVLVGYAAVLALAAARTGGGGFFPHALRRPGNPNRRVAIGPSAAPEHHTDADQRHGHSLRPTARRDVA